MEFLLLLIALNLQIWDHVEILVVIKMPKWTQTQNIILCITDSSYYPMDLAISNGLLSILIKNNR